MCKLLTELIAFNADNERIFYHRFKDLEIGDNQTRAVVWQGLLYSPELAMTVPREVEVLSSQVFLPHTVTHLKSVLRKIFSELFELNVKIRVPTTLYDSDSDEHD